ncbi:MAG: glutamate--cysteine ligase [Gammaproteobacteria bacterium]|nr:glutamate--cysteine ligase [Gammaproteobacteria bacterium]
MASIKQQLEQLSSAQVSKAIQNIRRGIERETLRVNQDGKLSQKDHPKALGSALTHHYVTTDFSEALLELITPPSNDIKQTYTQLKDIHKFVLNNIDDEVLWPMSMPCFIKDQDDIRIAQYGDSNIGKMKTTYRHGLKNRYGSMMQAISGIHYNFSIPTDFWKILRDSAGSKKMISEYQSELYMRMVRNIKRYVWFVTYLFGASPAMCSSFLQGRETGLAFEKFGKGSIFMKNGTSLRMSDLGYTNSAQSALNIQYGSLTQYITKLREAIQTESAEYQDIGVKVDGEYKQLNHNILQIENELYAPVRPKQVAESGEKPTDALEKRGIMYIELRALDVNPFSPYGITIEQMRMLDLFLLYTLFVEDDELTTEQQKEAEQNQDKVVIEGRDPNLSLSKDGVTVPIQQWLLDIYNDLQDIAFWLDGHYSGDEYVSTLKQFADAMTNPEQTLSGQWMNKLLSANVDNGELGMTLAKQYASEIKAHQESEFGTEFLIQQALQSIDKQKQIESSDKLSFDEFLQDYFSYATA